MNTYEETKYYLERSNNLCLSRPLWHEWTGFWNHTLDLTVYVQKWKGSIWERVWWKGCKRLAAILLSLWQHKQRKNKPVRINLTRATRDQNSMIKHRFCRSQVCCIFLKQTYNTYVFLKISPESRKLLLDQTLCSGLGKEQMCQKIATNNDQFTEWIYKRIN